MADRIRCFALEPTGQVELSLRRYRLGDSKCDRSRHGYCDVDVIIERTTVADLIARGWPALDGRLVHDGSAVPHDDPRWPARCGCGYEFQADDSWHCDPDTLWRRSDNNELITLDHAPVGAMWFAPWYADSPEYRGPDGNSLVVRLPPDGHDWIIDSRASNCDSPCKKCGVPYNKHPHDGKACRYEDNHPHKCWIRRGAPPDVTVNKAGVTCGAGGGSIKTPRYHGFLRNGWLEGKVSAPAPKPDPSTPSAYVKITEILKAAADGHTKAGLAQASLIVYGQPIPQKELDRALLKGKTKGTFIETGGIWRHVSRA